MNRLWNLGVVAAVSLAGMLQPIAGRGQSKTHWVATWATAQDLAPTVPDRPSIPPGTPRPNFGGNRNPAPPPPTDIHDQTVRMTVKIGVGGAKFRVELSNAFGKKPVLIGAAHVARKGDGSATVAGTDRALTFSGHAQAQIAPGMVLTSDPVELSVPDSSKLAVSLYVKDSEGAPTTHALGLHTTYLAPGDQTASAEMPSSSTTTTSYLWLSGIDVQAPADRFSIVTLGDSITDGYKTTVDADRAWPALLQDRLLSTPGAPKASVLNEGISGNQVLRDGAGVSAMARLDRDVFTRAGVKWIVLLEGINDINIHGQVEGEDALVAEDLIAGYKQIIARAHLYNIKVMGATLTPDEGVFLSGPIGEATRQKVNAWVRTPGNFDAIVDLDVPLRTPGHAAKLREDLDPGDHIHPNDAGNDLMAKQFNLADFKRE